MIKANEFTVKIVNKENIESRSVISGGMAGNPIWDEYIGQFNDGFIPKLEMIKKLIIDSGLIGKTAEEVCNETAFEFSDGIVVSFTWRAWGDLMQAIIGKREGYMTYYMKQYW